MQVLPLHCHLSTTFGKARALRQEVIPLVCPDSGGFVVSLRKEVLRTCVSNLMPPAKSKVRMLARYQNKHHFTF